MFSAKSGVQAADLFPGSQVRFHFRTSLVFAKLREIVTVKVLAFQSIYSHFVVVFVD